MINKAKWLIEITKLDKIDTKWRCCRQAWMSMFPRIIQERLARCGMLREHSNRKAWTYKSKRSVCKNCPLRHQCLTENATTKKLDRWEHESVVDRHREHMKGASEMMKKRSAYVEHPFGTLKYRAGMHHFLMRGLEKCRGEFSLMVLCYNFTRVLNILGVAVFRDYCAQFLRSSEKRTVFA